MKTTAMLLSAFVCVCGICGSSAIADFVLIEDFDALDLGVISGQNDWHATTGSGTVAVDPTDASNQVLDVTTVASEFLYKGMTIPKGASRTLFYRFRITGQTNCSFGMTNFSNPDQNGQLESEMNIPNSGDLRINDGGTYSVLTTLTQGVWYNLWMHIDHANDTTAVYMNSTPGAAADESDRLSSADGDLFDFRQGTAYDLINFFIKTGSNTDSLYFDDFYLENTDALNLTNPVPEPGTAALVLIAAAGLLVLIARKTTRVGL